MFVTYNYVANPVTYPLDQLTPVTKASLRGVYSLATLFANSGPVVQISNTSAATVTANFYGSTSGTSLTTGALGTGLTLAQWLAANPGTAYVTTWYDQSGSGNHGTTSTAAQRPFINVASVPWTVDMSSGQSYFNLPSGTIPMNSTNTLHYKMNPPVSGVNGGIMGAGSLVTGQVNGLNWQNNPLYNLSWYNINFTSYFPRFTNPMYSTWITSNTVPGPITSSVFSGGSSTTLYNISAFNNGLISTAWTGTGWNGVTGNDVLGKAPNNANVYAQMYRALVSNAAVSAQDQWVIEQQESVTSSPWATGGIVTSYNANNVTYYVHSFFGSSVFNCSSILNADILVVGGGGGGGSASGSAVGGGGGAGGLQLFQNQNLAPGSYPVTIGLGGAGGAPGNNQGANGTNSQFGTLNPSVGGGGGGSNTGNNIGTGGSGGGQSNGALGPGIGIPGQGYPGGIGVNVALVYGAGGGGGAGGPGANGNSTTNGGNGGPGMLVDISGVPTYYAGGGGGGVYTSGTPGTGGSGGGGTSGSTGSGNSGTGFQGQNGLGGGGGGGSGASATNWAGGSGGSGIVVVRYAVPTVQDAYQASTLLLLHCDSFVDSGPYQNQLTLSNAVISTSTLKFGTGSLQFTANNTVSTTILPFGSANFTVEFWVNPVSNTAGSLVSSTNQWWTLSLVGGKVQVFNASANGVAAFLTGNFGVPNGSWSSVILQKIGSQVYLFVNGNLDVFGSINGSWDTQPSTTLVLGQGLQGYLDEVRVSLVARYPLNFQPQAVPWNPDSSTVLLMHCDPPADSSPYNVTLTSANTFQVATSNSTVGAGGLFLNSNTAVFAGLVTPTSTNYALGSNDFTIEFWINLLSTGNSPVLMWNGVGSSNWSMIISGTSLQTFSNPLFGASGLGPYFNLTPGTWTHYAVQRASNVCTVSVNGTLIGSNAFVNQAVDSGGSQKILIGNYPSAGGTSNILCYLDEVRISKVARYPIDPLFSNVSLLLHCQGPNGGSTFTDSSGYNQTITNVGGITTSTASYQFGNSSLYSTGATGSNYLSVNSSALVFGTNNFTIEFWINASAPNSGQRCFGTLSLGSYGTNNWAIGFNAGDGSLIHLDCFNVSGFPQMLTSTTAMTPGTWYHIAFTRNGSTFYMFQNGVLQASKTSAVSFDGGVQHAVYIGWSGYSTSSATEYFNGYLSDIRITNGVARYTSNFAVPTASFPNSANFTPYNSYFTPDANTSLLIHADDTTDAALRAPLSANGATVSTLTKFGTGSLGFSGNTYANTNSSTNYYFGSNNFTTEFWFFSNTSNVQTLLTNPGVWSLSTGTAYYTSGLLAYYDFSKTASYPGTGTAITDLSGNNNNLTLTGTFTYFASPPSLMIVTSGAYASGTTISGTPTAITWEYLVYQISTANNPVIFNSFGGFAQVSGTDNKINTNPNMNFTTKMTLGSWTHVAITANSSACVLYINGIQVESQAGTTGFINYNHIVGNYQPSTTGYYMNAKLGMLRVYNTALTASQVSANYNSVKFNWNAYGLP